MRFNTLSAIALSCGIAHALPADGPKPTAAPELLPRGVDGKAPWISVDNNAQPEKTFTPTYTTIDGTTSYIDTARHDLTASLFTWTTYGVLHTSTGEPPNPTADSSNGQGSLSVCSKDADDENPFCHPYVNSTLLVDRTYYITWDPKSKLIPQDEDSKKNQTFQMSLEIDYLNKTESKPDKFELVTIKKLDKVFCKNGFVPLTVDKKLLKGHKTSNNITLKFFTSRSGENNLKQIPYMLNVTVHTLDNPEDPKREFPKGKKLAIALPTIIGAIALLVIGVCIWNRKTRRIELGNIMSRSRNKGYSGRKERRNLFRNNRDADIALDTSPPRGAYHDEPSLARRDSDGLGSLAGSPIDGSFEQQGTTGGRNAFRDEMSRQQAERHDDRF